MRTRAVLVVVALLAALLGFAQPVTTVAAAPARPPVGAAASAASAPTPVVNGNRLVDSRTNRTFVPHGANWPSFEYACAQGWGYNQGGATAAAASAMASWHINVVRIPLNEECWSGLDPAHDYGTVAGYKSALNSWVTTLNAAGIAVILDLHFNAPAGHRALGQYPMPDSRSTAFWASVAAAYANNPSVIFDVFNEPYSIWNSNGQGYFYQLTWNCWENGGAGCNAPNVGTDQQPSSPASTYPIVGMSTLVTAIRNAGATQPIMLGGLNYSNDLSGWLAHEPTDPDAQLIASWHNYPGQDDCGYTPACWDAATTTVAAAVPIITGEFGETDGSATKMTAYMNWADSKGIGYLPWAWWDATGQDHDNALYALFKGPNFVANAPTGTNYKAHLASIAGRPTRIVKGQPTPITIPGFVPGPAAAIAQRSQPIGAGSTANAAGLSPNARRFRGRPSIAVR